MVLITGGTGVMGRGLCAALREKGESLRVLSLPDDSQAQNLARDGIEIAIGDITRPQTLRTAMRDATTVYHMAAVILSPTDQALFTAVNDIGTRNIVEAAEKSGVRHLIYISSASVTYPRSNPYSRSKMRAEYHVSQSAVPCKTIVRPTLVYEDGGGAEFCAFVEHLKRFPVVPFIGNGRVIKRPVHAQDLIAALASICGNMTTCGKTYNLSGGERITLRDMAIALLRHMGCEKVILPVPVSACRYAALVNAGISRLAGITNLLTWQTISGVTQAADLDNKESCRDLDFTPRGFRDGLESLVSLRGCLRKNR